jgi:hypothetical protein
VRGPHIRICPALMAPKGSTGVDILYDINFEKQKSPVLPASKNDISPSTDAQDQLGALYVGERFPLRLP